MDEKTQQVINALLPVREQVSKAAIFGSWLTDPSTANDIDVMIWVDPKLYDNVRNILSGAGDNIHVEKIQCNYTQLPKDNASDRKQSTNALPIHIAALPTYPSEYMRSDLWKKHHTHLTYIF